MRLTHIRLLADNTEECAAFYRDVLGLELTLEAGGGVYYEFATGGTILGLYKRDLMSGLVGFDLSAPDPTVESSALTFAVDDVDTVYRELGARGVEFANEPHDLPEAFLRTVHLRDPAGHLVELNAPLTSGP